MSVTISPFSAYFVGHFCYHINGKSYINAKLLHLFFLLLINQSEEIGDKRQLSVFGSRALMHVAQFFGLRRSRLLFEAIGSGETVIRIEL